jgi:4-amino-4-deoxy-L-arabinose transferase-like glycosyltransferase
VGGLHPYTSYLIQVSGIAKIQFQPFARVPAGYGSPSYYGAVDRGAPRPHPGWAPASTPILLPIYPFGYYALVALWLGLISRFTGSLVALFFGARILSVLLLTGSLLLSYGIARELRLKKWLALLVTAIIGIFPLTSFVSSYVQPDNLGLTLVSLSLYLALLVRRNPNQLGLLAALGVTVGFLLVTKYQFWFCVLVPVLGMLVTQQVLARGGRAGWTRVFGWARMFALLLVPSVVLGLIQLWVTWKARSPYSATLGSKAVGGEVNYAAAHDALSQGMGPFVAFVLAGISDAFNNYINGGVSFTSFFGYFGWMDTPLIIGSPETQQQIHTFSVDITLLVLALAVVRLGRVTWFLGRLARRRKWRGVARVAFHDPVLNSLFLFTLFMFFLYVMTNNTFGAQGRNWFPYILPLFLIGIVYAPKALPGRLPKLLFSRFIVLCLGLYAVVGAYSAVQSVSARYYGTNGKLSVSLLRELKRATGTTAASISAVLYSGKIVTIAKLHAPIIVPSGQIVTVTGWAVDTPAQSTADGVFLTVDDWLNYPLFYSEDRPDVARLLGNLVYEQSGFSGTVPTTSLAPGGHYLRLKIVTKNQQAYYEPTWKVKFTIQ